MCNLYRLRIAPDLFATLTGAPLPPSNAGEEVYPGQAGIALSGLAGARAAASMAWGFPLKLASMRPESKPKPVNNIRDLAKPMWSGIARKPEWRCIIPLTAFAEAEGPKGGKTRTWFSVADAPLIGWAGLWRASAEWGPVYAGVMTDANAAVRPVHDRMPLLLDAADWDEWLTAPFDALLAMQQATFDPARIVIDRTGEPWAAGRAAAADAGSQARLF